jgi:hypothetical protein
MPLARIIDPLALLEDDPLENKERLLPLFSLTVDFSLHFITLRSQKLPIFILVSILELPFSNHDRLLTLSF